PPVPASTPVYDACAYLSFIAARTSRIRLGTFVYLLGIRHPFVGARAFATLHVVSGGHAEVGVGAGWLVNEWEAVGLDPRTRGRRAARDAVERDVPRRFLEGRRELPPDGRGACRHQGLRVKFAITFGQLNPAFWLDAALLADELGFESVWLPEHLVFPVEMHGELVPGEEHPPVPASTPVYDACAYLSFIAARTSRIRLGTFVYLMGSAIRSSARARSRRSTSCRVGARRSASGQGGW
ncbi:MAG: LLM class flavin-dependent oxidoreductase, partial [Actinomycetota bacterium]